MSESGQSVKDNRLKQEVKELRDLVRQLTLRLDRQDDQISELETEVSLLKERETAARPSSPSPVEFSFRQVPESGKGSYTVVSSEASIAAGPRDGSWELRVEVARQIGSFLSRSLAGEFRGNSGRDRLAHLQSRYYLVVRDWDDNVYTNPVRVLSKFSSVQALCKRRSGWGRSIVVGLPSLEECEIAIQQAGFVWPAVVEN